MLSSFSFQQIAEITAGQWLVEPADLSVSAIAAITTDSRDIPANALYLPLIGERFDGHRFITAAVKDGATMVITEQDNPELSDCSVPVLHVDSTLLAYGQLAAAQRQLFTGSVFSVTGSAGKTSVKQMLHTVLSVRYPTFMTAGNLNNHIGAPKSLLSIDPSHQAAVIELGASAIGEIAYTAQFARPNIGILTNAGDAHLEGFGSLEGIVQTKGELLDYIEPDGTAILNADDPHCGVWQKRASHLKQILFGFSERADVRATDIDSDITGCRFTLNYQNEKQSVRLSLIGQHNIANAVAVAAAALANGFTLAEIAEGLGNCQAVAGRMQLLTSHAGYSLINDAYNANPSSFKAAIDSLSGTANSVLVMGDMAEIGEAEVDAHIEIGEYAQQQGITQLIACGPLSQHAVTAFGDGGYWFASQADLIDFIDNNIQAPAHVLVKGSRSAGMEHVVTALQLPTEEKKQC